MYRNYKTGTEHLFPEFAAIIRDDGLVVEAPGLPPSHSKDGQVPWWLEQHRRDAGTVPKAVLLLLRDLQQQTTGLSSYGSELFSYSHDGWISPAR